MAVLSSVKTAKRKRMELATLKDNRLQEGGNSSTAAIKNEENDKKNIGVDFKK